MMKKKLTILVNTCDKYRDVMKLFFISFKKYWPQCEYEMVVNSETYKYDCYNVDTHIFTTKIGVNNWGARLRKTIDYINSEYILMVFDDYLLEDTIDDARIKDAIKLMDSEPDIAVIYLTQQELPKHDYSEKYQELDDRIDFRLNSVPGIWRKEVLKKYTGEIEDPWAWEVYGSIKTWGDGLRYLIIGVNEKNIYEYSYKTGGAIYRGRWVRKVVEKEIYSRGNIDFNERGYTEDLKSIKRSIKWKLEFLILGFRMVGLKVVIPIARYIKSKTNKK